MKYSVPSAARLQRQWVAYRTKAFTAMKTALRIEARVQLNGGPIVLKWHKVELPCCMQQWVVMARNICATLHCKCTHTHKYVYTCTQVYTNKYVWVHYENIDTFRVFLLCLYAENLLIINIHESGNFMIFIYCISQTASRVSSMRRRKIK